ncbi:MAG TPA: cytochrome c oxidase subunit II [Candidatus Dormibacteraeota bacterium]|nr:cytochrome c oxidase subunit II [Candidatus Dormibacteraeota bacterium]
MAHQVGNIDFRRHLDRSFWSATLVMGVISAILMALVVIWPINDTLAAASDTAHTIDPIFKFMLFFAAPIFVYVNGYVIYFARRYKHRASEPADAVGIPLHGVTSLEIWWTVLPTVLMVVLGIWSAIGLFALYKPQPGALNLESIGHQWSFEFRYPGLKKSFYGNPYVPVDKPVTLNITSADVIHSFWVPQFRIKLDMVPGMVQQLHFTPEKIGVYPVICTEYCGVGHGDMQTTIHVVSQADYNAWLAGMQQKEQTAQAQGPNLAAGDPDKGKQIFAQKCSVCHNIAPFAQKKVGPGLQNIFDDPQHPKLVDGAAATPANVAHILQTGYSGDIGVMPNAQANGLSSGDIADLVAYLKSQSK